MRVYRRLLPYGVAIGSTAIALLLRLWLESLLSETLGGFFYLAILISTWYGGFRPGFVSVILSALAINYFLLSPRSQFSISQPKDILQLSIFLLVAFSINLLTSKFLKSKHQIQQLSAKLAQENAEQLRMALAAAHTAIDERKQAQSSLQQEFEQQRLVMEMSQRIRRSLNLQDILQTTVDEVRQFLQCDRVTIFKFSPGWGGTIIVESVAPEWMPILPLQIYDPCIGEENVKPFKQGLVTAKGDIYNSGISPCHVEFLASLQVRANLVVPVLQGDELWGLLAAHHCAAPREWQSREIELLRQLGEQVSIAIQQAALFEQVQTELRERQQTQQSLQEREATLRLFIQYAPAGIAMFDQDMRYVLATQRWVEDYRLDSIESLIGRSHYEVFPEISEQWRQIHQRCLAGTSERCDEDLFTRLDGTQQWIRWEIHPWHTFTGEIGGIIIFTDDITERKQAQVALQQLNAELEQRVAERTEALREASDRLLERVIEQQQTQLLLLEQSQLLDLAHDTIMTRDFNGVITFWNEGIVASRWVLHTDNAGRPIKILEINNDITAKKQTQAALEKYVHEVEDLYNNAPCGYHSLDAQGNMIRINNTELKWLGYTRDEVLHQKFTKFLTGESQQIFQENFPKFKQQGWINNLEFELVNKDSTIRWVSLNATAIKDAVGNFLMSRSTLFDISERKQTEAALCRSEEKFRQLADNIQAVFWITDIHDHQVLYISNAYESIWQRSCDSLYQNPLTWLEAIHPGDRQNVEIAFSEQIKTGKFEQKYRIIRPDGSIRWIHDRAFPIKNDIGEIIRLAGIAEDITEKEHIEQIKSEFIGIVSHELRTPLTAIRAAMGLLQTGIYDNKPDKFKRMIEIAAIDSDRLVRLVNDILDLERLESGRAVLEKTTCSAADLIEQAVAGVQAIAKQQNINLNIQPTDAQVWAAADTIIQTLTNILGNAIKFSPANTTITLSVQPQTDCVLFQITDQGRGIPADKLEAIFGRFQQVDASDSRSKGGTGLGLAICRSIIEQHGGKIWTESAVDVGSTFYFTLPLPTEELR